jgi:hypothetical protein
MESVILKPRYVFHVPSPFLSLIGSSFFYSSSLHFDLKCSYEYMNYALKIYSGGLEMRSGKPALRLWTLDGCKCQSQ